MSTTNQIQATPTTTNNVATLISEAPPSYEEIFGSLEPQGADRQRSNSDSRTESRTESSRSHNTTSGSSRRSSSNQTRLSSFTNLFRRSKNRPSSGQQRNNNTNTSLHQPQSTTTPTQSLSSAARMSSEHTIQSSRPPPPQYPSYPLYRPTQTQTQLTNSNSAGTRSINIHQPASMRVGGQHTGNHHHHQHYGASTNASTTLLTLDGAGTAGGSTVGSNLSPTHAPSSVGATSAPPTLDYRPHPHNHPHHPPHSHHAHHHQGRPYSGRGGSEVGSATTRVRPNAIPPPPHHLRGYPPYRHPPPFPGSSSHAAGGHSPIRAHGHTGSPVLGQNIAGGSSHSLQNLSQSPVVRHHSIIPAVATHASNTQSRPIPNASHWSQQSALVGGSHAQQGTSPAAFQQSVGASLAHQSVTASRSFSGTHTTGAASIYNRPEVTYSSSNDNNRAPFKASPGANFEATSSPRLGAELQQQQQSMQMRHQANVLRGQRVLAPQALSNNISNSGGPQQFHLHPPNVVNRRRVSDLPSRQRPSSAIFLSAEEQSRSYRSGVPIGPSVTHGTSSPPRGSIVMVEGGGGVWGERGERERSGLVVSRRCGSTEILNSQVRTYMYQSMK